MKKLSLFFTLSLVFVSSCNYDTKLDPINIESKNLESKSFTTKATIEDKAWIPVSFQSQFDTGKSTNNWCCGIASANMGTAYLHGKTPTSEYLKKMYQYLGKNSGCSGGTTQYEQLSVAKNVGNAKNSYNKFMTFEEAKRNLREGNPIVVGLGYSKISNKCSNFSGYHSVLLIGYNGTQGYWVVNDPLCKTASSGLNKKIPSSEFRAATRIWSSVNGGGSSDDIFGTILKR